MSRAAHNDAPEIDPQTQEIYDLIMRQAPRQNIQACLRGSFDLAARVMDAPGYVQPNGFLTFKLGGVDGDHLLRLHLWPKGLPQLYKAAGIHDHVFDFTSLVLCGDGAMINTVYQEKADSSGALGLYEVNYTTPKTSQIIKLGDHFSATAVEREIIRPGEYYTMNAGVFHTSQIENNAEAATIIATRMDPDIRHPRFLSETSPDAQFVRPPLTREHRNRLVTVLNRVL